MSWYRNNWYYVGGILFVIMAFVVGIFGPEMEPTRRLMILFFMALVLHEFEEYVLPGGFPIALNMGMFGETELPDRYPGNTLSCIIVNIYVAYPLYIAGIIFHDFYSLGLFIAYFGMAQIGIHGIMLNKKLHLKYNPGMATVFLVLVPLGIYYICYVSRHFDVTLWGWLLPLILLFPVCFLTILFPIIKLKDKNTKYVLPERDSKGFTIEGGIARLKR